MSEESVSQLTWTGQGVRHEQPPRLACGGMCSVQLPAFTDRQDISLLIKHFISLLKYFFFPDHLRGNFNPKNTMQNIVDSPHACGFRTDLNQRGYKR